MFRKSSIIVSILLLSFIGKAQESILKKDVLVIGGSASGIAAGIQSARLKVQTLVVEEGPWLGGMLSSAGVSAIDGNYQLPSGIFGEFIQKIFDFYGGKDSVKTGWVSNILFEPHRANAIWEDMAAEEKDFLTLVHGYRLQNLILEGKVVRGAIFQSKTGESLKILAKQIIDATELGDAAKMAGIPYDIGLESSNLTGEKINIFESKPIIQDLTWVAILKDEGKKAKMIDRPANYDPKEFDGSNKEFYFDSSRKKPLATAESMLNYGKLPHGKYLLNWPIYGNDFYGNMIDASEAEREKIAYQAKQQTLRFIYFIQHELGFKNLGLAEDEFPTEDHLALIPYHRESRRIHGLVRFQLNHIADPYQSSQQALYRTGFGVGDYPIDHHHKKNLAAPQQLEFFPVPSFSMPLGILVSENSNLIIAEKSVSVSNVVNGTTRLQPCVVQIGQAAGALAALAFQEKIAPQDVNIRQIQAILLDAGQIIQPYVDVPKSHPHFKAIQKIGSTGLVQAIPVPGQWENYTYFFPESLVETDIFLNTLEERFPLKEEWNLGKYLKFQDLINILNSLPIKPQEAAWEKVIKEELSIWGFDPFIPQRPVKKVELAHILDCLGFFELFDCDIYGNYSKK